MPMQTKLGPCRSRFYWLNGQGAVMGVDPVRADQLSDLEGEIFDALLTACRMNDHKAAEMLFKVWIKLPNQRPWPLGNWTA
jgi:hypothetical protein